MNDFILTPTNWIQYKMLDKFWNSYVRTKKLCEVKPKVGCVLLFISSWGDFKLFKSSIIQRNEGKIRALYHKHVLTVVKYQKQGVFYFSSLLKSHFVLHTVWSRQEIWNLKIKTVKSLNSIFSWNHTSYEFVAKI